jgi:hypothetical protein
VNIPHEHVPHILIAVEHYAAYMKATARDERAYLEIAESLKKKRQSQAEPDPRTAKKKRA